MGVSNPRAKKPFIGGVFFRRRKRESASRPTPTKFGELREGVLHPMSVELPRHGLGEDVMDP